MNTSSNSDSEGGLASLELCNISKIDKSAIQLTPTVAGKVLKIDLDTGAAVSVISHPKYTQIFTEVKMHQTPLMLKIYSREKNSIPRYDTRCHGIQ